MDTITRLLDDGDPVVAVVGATDNPQKFGNRIYLDLKGKGFRVYAVNPFRATVDDDPTYASLSELPVTPDILTFVVPPARTLRILEQAKDLGLKRVWIQPGAENEVVMAYLAEHQFDYVADDCIMVRTRVRSTI